MRKSVVIAGLIVYILAIVQGVTANRKLDTTNLPIGGFRVPELEAFDQAMLTYMSDRQIEAGILVIKRGDTVVYERSFGWKDQEATIALSPNSLMRIASVTKPMTMAAIEKLISNGTLSRNDKVFCLGSSVGCWLDLVPFGTPDPGLETITIENLLDHKGGWDRSVSGDPMFMSIFIANELGIPSPPEPSDIARYMMGQPLNHDPGTTYAYSNFGYMLLGLIIEEATGTSYTNYIKSDIFQEIGVPSSEIELGKTRPNQRNTREPWYDSPYLSSSVFPPHNLVPWPDGGWYLEAMAAHGGMISTGRSLVEFSSHYNGKGLPHDGEESWVWFGSLDGTFSMLRWRADDTYIAAIFNNRDFGPPHSEISSIMDSVADNISSWPTTEPGTGWERLYLPTIINQ